ncbi:hypothetical protein E4U38_004062 [Claviceps purpurea]|nr:hypothetical protein E4U38_004062 [Claviceps purpurea]KAG6167292.1 hypothetical protein E4U51_002989 [Claviceps purpurea]KAG6194266.1 hypothetical protein E4U10_003130 [Claviceps purpurea]KAG6222704.1 hypothetical protein E4U26_005099 [Claviceps purpurea]KAG6260248.1 hypothetical protein E4U49_005096 [Claviceps purpurea]
MRFCNLFTSLLLGISVTSVTLASPFDSEGDLQDRTVILDDRGLRLVIAKGKEPKKDATCPYRARAGNFGPYPQHKYTKNQIKVAFIAGAQYAADDKQVGARKYPHDFGNGEKLPFPCGKNKMEFPIDTNNNLNPYSGGPSDNVPDRVVFEYQRKKRDLVVGYCGVMRHGTGRDFVKCT